VCAQFLWSVCAFIRLMRDGVSFLEMSDTFVDRCWVFSIVESVVDFLPVWCGNAIRFSRNVYFICWICHTLIFNSISPSPSQSNLGIDCSVMAGLIFTLE